MRLRKNNGRVKLTLVLTVGVLIKIQRVSVTHYSSPGSPAVKPQNKATQARSLDLVSFAPGGNRCSWLGAGGIAINTACCNVLRQDKHEERRPAQKRGTLCNQSNDALTCRAPHRTAQLRQGREPERDTRKALPRRSGRVTV